MNKQEIINKLNLIYTNKRTTAQTKAYNNLLLARQNPDFVKTEKQIKELSFEVGKAKALETPDVTNLDNKLKSAQIRLELLLKQMNLTVSDLAPKYTCKNCHDTGRRRGKLCDCYKKELYTLLLKNSGAKENLAKFEQFDDKLITNDNQKNQLTKLKAKFISWVNEYPNTKTHTFLLCGTTGVGKTFITECVADAMIKKGHLVSFISAFGLNNSFLKYHTTFDDNKNDYYDMFTEPDLLVIDDLGTEPILKNVTLNYLCALLNDRYTQKKATIITTNLDLEQILNRYGDRIFSRIINKADSQLFKIDGDDLRLKRR